MKRRSTLERQMLTYFGLIAAASLLITLEYIWAINAVLREVATSAGPALAQKTSSPAVGLALNSLRNQAILMCVVQAVVTLIVLVMLIRRITGPLQEMIEHSRAISEGDLSRTIEIRRRDEIGLLGETINGLTSNLQEIVAFALSTETSLRTLSEEMSKDLPKDSPSRNHLDEIQLTLAGFRDILEDFKLFPAPLGGTEEGEKS